MSAPRGIRGVVFDLDNTLVQTQIDYERMNRCVLQELMDSGVDASLLDAAQSVVENIRAGKRHLARTTTDFDPVDLDRRINELLMASEMERIDRSRIVPGAAEAVEELRSRGFGTAVLTRGSRGYALTLLARSGLDGRLGPCVCRDDHPLEEAKPNPMAMRRVAAIMGLEAGSCAYAGDHPMDLECAKGAGAWFIGVLTGGTTETMWKERGCQTVIDSVALIPRILP